MLSLLVLNNLRKMVMEKGASILDLFLTCGNNFLLVQEHTYFFPVYLNWEINHNLCNKQFLF